MLNSLSVHFYFNSQLLLFQLSTALISLLVAKFDVEESSQREKKKSDVTSSM